MNHALLFNALLIAIAAFGLFIGQPAALLALAFFEQLPYGLLQQQYLNESQEHAEESEYSNQKNWFCVK